MWLISPEPPDVFIAELTRPPVRTDNTAWLIMPPTLVATFFTCLANIACNTAAMIAATRPGCLTVTDRDAIVPLGAGPKKVMDLLLPRLVGIGLVSPAGAADYQRRTGLAAGERSLASIRAIQARRAAKR